ncbi:3-phosphoshikimate 1-carboxyvinyltransferase [bacterium C-53]|nr:3-phosphoshikimate 1-carboxyvinyltransferase [Lachnospiraceae bacterium]NBI01816.1 3-phosphoshikimate 1-carboxyvinyltransferase [Lachnospiraceae bacterium]RKJ12231.1 3-phosphoshikimate 1-carboxyvinyltransferase [bacterium C-53]
MKITHAKSLRGELTVPGDKSISHRAVMFGSISEGMTEITNFLNGADCLSTISCFQKMGIDITQKDTNVTIHGKGLHGLTRPDSVLDCGNSGTTTRLISGILAGQSFETQLTGDASIRKRPMKRIITPLSLMGADIKSMQENECAPLIIRPASLHGIHYDSPVASAQVKSSILLAGLYAKGPTSVTEPHLSRNHTEIMLHYFGAEVTSEGTTSSLMPDVFLKGQKVHVPGDISSAAYFLAAGLLVPGSEILIRNVGINKTRDGILRVLKEMGGNITLLNEQYDQGEPTADLLVKSSPLHGTIIGGELIPTLIDEIPVLAIAASLAEGTTIIRDAAELKVKESNRIDVMVENLSAMGAAVQATEDGMIIEGKPSLKGAKINSCNDHRIAMSFAVAGLIAEGDVDIAGAECVNISYPDFYRDLYSLCQKQLI